MWSDFYLKCRLVLKCRLFLLYKISSGCNAICRLFVFLSDNKFNSLIYNSLVAVLLNNDVFSMLHMSLIIYDFINSA